MALSGSCQTGTWTGETTSGKLVFNWTATQNQSNNTSTISWNIKASVTSGWITYSELRVRINGEQVYYRDATNHTQASNGTQLASGTKVLTHNADGTRSFSVEIGAGIFNYSINKTGSGTFTLNSHTVYSLALSAGTGSTITVNRTSSGYATTGNLSNGSRLYKGDKLIVSFSASNGYGLSVHTLNGSTFASGGSHTVGANVNIVSTAMAAYSLSISVGTGSTITVNRTSSSVAGTGNLSNGATIYKNDTLKITFSANTNYEIVTHTVNGVSFVSGGTHTVNGNTAVVSTARVLASGIGATNADIGSVSTITIAKSNPSYWHSLFFSFEHLTGYITSNGSVSSTEVKFQNDSVPFTVPATFYDQIPNSKTGECTISCKTYSTASSSTVIGEEAICTFIVTASANLCAPLVSGSVVDTNEVTAALTGDTSTLVRYKSIAECTISATPRNSATITSKLINGVVPTNDQYTFSGVAATSFTFLATDSRGYSNYSILSVQDNTLTVIPYVQLTCNLNIARQTPTSNILNAVVSGNYYRGSFGAINNTLKLFYRYKDATVNNAQWSSWTEYSGTFAYGSNSYSASFTIQINDNMSYLKAYNIQVKAEDGNCTVNGVSRTLSSITKNISIPRGTPVYDWGNDDFQFNVDVGIDGNLNLSGDIELNGDVHAIGNVQADSDFLLNGNSIVVKQKTVSFSNVHITTQSSNGAYYTVNGYNPSDYNISGTIIGLMNCGWSGASATFIPYYQNGTIKFFSDISQTVLSVSVLVTYI